MNGPLIQPIFNPHAPGSIGDVTPSTLAGTTLTLTNTTEQARIRYDGSNYITCTVNSAGGVTFNSVGGGAQHSFSLGGTESLRIAPNQVLALGEFNGIFVLGNGSSFVATRVRLGVDANAENGSGLGCAATGTVTMLSGGTEVARWTATQITIASGVSLQLGNTAAAGTITADKTLLFKDATGTSYKVPCVAA